MRAYNQGWGYKLNYDREIETDLQEIAQVERHVPIAATLTEAERAMGSFALGIHHWLMADVSTRAPLLGITESDAHDLAWYWDSGLPESTEPAPGWYGRAEAISKRLSEQFGDYVIRDPAEFLKKLRTRLARHRRNKAKFGS